MTRSALRMREIAPFRVMEIMAQAKAMEAAGRDIVHMEIGEPDFVSPQPVIDAAIAAQRAGLTHYTPAAGLSALREAIAGHYQDRFGVAVDPARILVTPGASGALQLALGASIDPGDRVLITDPGYPCNRHLISLFGGRATTLPVSVENGYAVTPRSLEESLTEDVRALMLASPANPTGHSIENHLLRDLLIRLRQSNDRLLICDEIYQGLQYERPPETACALSGDDLIVINSFSKFFGMTGWRVGWLVAPKAMVEPIERLAQNLFLAAPTAAQHAAVAALGETSLEILEARRTAFWERRDFLYDALQQLGFGVGERPRGAFYLYVDAAAFTDNSDRFAQQLLAQTGVAITPGSDFGTHRADHHVRFAYTTALDRLAVGVERLRGFLRAGG